MNNIYIALLFAILFLGANLLNYVGIDTKLVHALIIGISIPLLIIRKNEVLSNKPLVGILLLVGIFSLHKLITDTGEGARMATLQILGAPIIYAALPKLDYRISKANVCLWQKINKLIFIFYCLEVGMAILERIIGHTILGWSGTESYIISRDSTTEFRSTALLGHPLYNALVVSTMMSFFLMSPLKIHIKLLLWFTGYFAIFCFNGRSSIVGNTLMFLVFTVYTLFFDKKAKRKDKKILAAFSVLACIALYIGIVVANIGGRLFEMGLFDDSSAQTRIDVWNIFNYFTLADFLWGIDFNKIGVILYSSGLHATENFWIDQLFSFGLVFMIMYVILYSLLFSKLLKGYSTFKALFVTGTFILLASTNNSLSSSFVALFIFIILCHSFNPQYILYLFPYKYLESNNRKKQKKYVSRKSVQQIQRRKTQEETRFLRRRQ